MALRRRRVAVVRYIRGALVILPFWVVELTECFACSCFAELRIVFTGPFYAS